MVSAEKTVPDNDVGPCHQLRDALSISRVKVDCFCVLVTGYELVCFGHIVTR